MKLLHGYLALGLLIKPFGITAQWVLTSTVMIDTGTCATATSTGSYDGNGGGGNGTNSSGAPSGEDGSGGGVGGGSPDSFSTAASGAGSGSPSASSPSLGSGVSSGFGSAIDSVTGAGAGTGIAIETGSVTAPVLGSNLGFSGSTGASTSLGPTSSSVSKGYIPPGVPPVVDSSNGQYSFGGFYPLPEMGNLLNGARTTSVNMTLGYCASFCQVSPFFAILQGNECQCGTTAPTSASVPSPPGLTPCAGGPELCGSLQYAIVYRNSPPEPESSVYEFTSTNDNGIVTTGLGTSYFAASPSKTVISQSAGLVTYTTTAIDSLGFTFVGTSIKISSAANADASSMGSINGGSTGLATYAAPLTSTISQGSIVSPSLSIIAGGVSGTPVATSPSSPGATGTSLAYPCPQNDDYTFLDSAGEDYNIECSTSFEGIHLMTVSVGLFTSCMLMCDIRQTCVGVSWDINTMEKNCLLLSSISAVTENRAGIESAYRTNYTIINPSLSTLSSISVIPGSATPSPSSPAVTSLRGVSSTAQEYVPSPVSMGDATVSSVEVVSSNIALSIPPASSSLVDSVPADESSSTSEDISSPIPTYTSTEADGTPSSTDVALPTDSIPPSAVPETTEPLSTETADSPSTTDEAFSMVSATSILPSAETLTTASPSPDPVESPSSLVEAFSPTSIPPSAVPGSTEVSFTEAVDVPSSTDEVSSPLESSTSEIVEPSSTEAASSPSAIDITSSPISTPPSAIPSTTRLAFLGPATRTTTRPAGNPRPTVENPLPSCSPPAFQGNNTRYIDPLDSTYDIKCGFNVNGRKADHDAHADTFVRCLEYCDLLEGCEAVTYTDAGAEEPLTANCMPYTIFESYNLSASKLVYSGVNIHGPSTAEEFKEELCESQNGTIYGPDTFGTCYSLGCGYSTAGSQPNGSGNDLFATDVTTLLGCLTYCSIFDTCVAVDWTGPNTFGDDGAPNCYPKIETEVSIVAATSTQYASATECPIS